MYKILRFCPGSVILFPHAHVLETERRIGANGFAALVSANSTKSEKVIDTLVNMCYILSQG